MSIFMHQDAPCPKAVRRSASHAEPDDAYATRQQSRDRAYRREYENWVASLPPDERRKLRDLGLEAPEMPDTSTGGFYDAAEFADCAIHREALDAESPDADEVPATQDADTGFVHELLRQLVGELLARDNSRLSLECLALVSGLSYTGDSMSDIARRHRVTRAAVSRRCVDLSSALNLAPGRAMRPLKTRQNSRNARLTRLCRP